jgi:hypothetical protein
MQRLRERRSVQRPLLRRRRILQRRNLRILPERKNLQRQLLLEFDGRLLQWRLLAGGIRALHALRDDRHLLPNRHALLLWRHGLLWGLTALRECRVLPWGASHREGSDFVDDTRFDDLTRSLAGAKSRRSLLQALLGAGVASGLAATDGSATPKAAAARQKHKKKRCSAGRKCEDFCCAKGTFCWDPASKTCCAKGDACCNALSGSP